MKTNKAAAAGSHAPREVLPATVTRCPILCFYTAMGRGLISVVAPLAAVVGATIPVCYALARGERPGAAALIGMAIALVAVVAVSVAPSDPRHAHVAVTTAVVVLVTAG